MQLRTKIDCNKSFLRNIIFGAGILLASFFQYKTSGQDTKTGTPEFLPSVPMFSDLYCAGIEKYKLTNSIRLRKNAILLPNRKIVFESVEKGIPNLFIINFAGEENQLTNFNNFIGLNDCTSSQNGKSLAFVTYFFDKTSDKKLSSIHILDLESKLEKKLIDKEGEFSRLCFSQDNRKIFFIHRREEIGDIYSINFDGNDLTNLTNTPNTIEKFLSVSSNGKMTFTTEEDIYIMDLNSRKLKRLTDTLTPEYSVTLSRDGKTIAFSTFPIFDGFNPKRYNFGKEYNFDIYTMDSDGKNLKRITLTDHNRIEDNPVFSPDGKKIAFNRQLGKYYDLCVINIDGSEYRNITTSRPSESFPLRIAPSWSLDSKQIVFSYNQDIYSANLKD